MCWITNITPQSKLAEEDIPVFKIVRKSLRAYYQEFQYSIGRVFKTEINVPIFNSYEIFFINEGFHSYSAKECTAITTEESYKPIIKVYHTFYKLGSYIDACILECVIPKGSVYYLNGRGEYVSDHILPLKVRNW